LEDEDFVIPTDHEAINCIHSIIGIASGRIQKILWMSIGKSSTLGPRVDKQELYHFVMAKCFHVRMPKQWQEVPNLEENVSKMVLKCNNNYGGEGMIIASPKELPLNIAFDYFVQEYAEGEKIIHCCVCLEGKVLESLTIKVIASVGPTGPMRVGKLCNLPQISTSAVNLIKELNFTGFCDMDFVNANETCYLLDFNARPTYHSLALLNGKHMAQVLRAKMDNSCNFPSVTVPGNPNLKVVTMMEFMINPGSPLLCNSEGFLDFCFEDLPFLKTLVDYLLTKNGNTKE
jgi:predicted ATP-grasp superfamily ATP-dependent carboligase